MTAHTQGQTPDGRAPKSQARNSRVNSPSIRAETKRPLKTRAAPSVPVVCPATLRVSGPGELLEAIPYLIGFHPRRSLVMVGLAGSRVAVSLRMDLEDARLPPELTDSIAVLRRAQATAAVVALYVDERAEPGHSSPDAALLAEVVVALRAVNLQVWDVLLVCDERWWSYSAAATPDGLGGPGGRLRGDSAPIAAAAVFAGLVAHPDRATLSALLDPDPDQPRDRLRSLIAGRDASGVRVDPARVGRQQRSVKRSLFAAARDADGAPISGSAVALPEDVLVRYALGLRDIAVRDAIWLAVDQRRLDGRGFWLTLARRLPSPYDSAALFLFGWSSWRDGNGALASMAAERALRSDPGYSAAELLLSAVKHGLDPYRTPRLRSPRRESGERC